MHSLPIAQAQMHNTQVDKAEEIDAVIRMYDLKEYSENYLKTSRILYQFYRDKA